MFHVEQKVIMFSELIFKPSATYLEDGIQALKFFNNGYGVSVIRHRGSYGSEQGLYELAVIAGSEDKFYLVYGTPVTDDVLGYLTEGDVSKAMSDVKALPLRTYRLILRF